MSEKCVKIYVILFKNYKLLFRYEMTLRFYKLPLNESTSINSNSQISQYERQECAGTKQFMHLACWLNFWVGPN